MSDLIDPKKESDVMRDFYKKLEENLRTDFAKFLPDAVLREMIVKAVQKEFFEPTTKRNPRYNSYASNMADREEYIKQPSTFVGVCLESSKETLKKLAEDAVKEHTGAIQAAVKEVIDTQLLPALLPVLIFNEIRSQIGGGMSDISNRLQKCCEKLGVY